MIFVFLTYFTLWQVLDSSTSLQLTQFSSFLCLSNIPSYICVSQFLYPFTCWWHLGYFRVLATVKSAAMNTGYMCLFELWFSLESNFEGCVTDLQSSLICLSSPEKIIISVLLMRKLRLWEATGVTCSCKITVWHRREKNPGWEPNRCQAIFT